MNKEVIYIDVDDDITAIIGKIKASKEKIVALVPPKRTGVLQSAVNLRLLDRMAKSEGKNLVVITGNAALLGLTAAAKIPTAKNLQSKPEVAEIPALKVDGDDDIIDGATLPIGDHAELNGTKTASVSRDDIIETIDIDTARSSSKEVAAKSTKSKKPKIKIPNFDSFRKRVVLIVIAVVLVVAGLVWALVFAPAATIIVTANTSPDPINTQVKLTDKTDFSAGTIAAVSKTMEKDATVQFTATGTGQAGSKASGQIVFQNCEPSAVTIAAGTTVSMGSLSYVTATAATVPAPTFGYSGCIPGTSGDVGVTATDVGKSYNISNGSTLSVSGHSSSGLQYLRAKADGAFSGGDSHTITVVSDNDIQTALGQIVGQDNSDIKKQLSSQFTNGEYIIDSSFTATQGSAKTTPDKGAEVPDGTQATLTVPITYSIYAVAQADLTTYLDAAIDGNMGSTTATEVYDNGLKTAQISNFSKADDGTITATVNATGQIGPKLDKNNIKNLSKGKITGDVQAALSSIPGVSDVKVNYSYFWVNNVPGDTNKITVEFKVHDE